jgi:hypothetical protein
VRKDLEHQCLYILPFGFKKPNQTSGTTALMEQAAVNTVP